MSKMSGGWQAIHSAYIATPEAITISEASIRLLVIGQPETKQKAKQRFLRIVRAGTIPFQWLLEKENGIVLNDF